MIEKIIAFIKSNHLITSKDFIIAAVSGGVDSMVMLHCLNSVKEQFDFNLSVIHVNHGVRPGDADEDETLVQNWCNDHQLKFYSTKLNGFNFESSEDALRRARYSAFNEIICQYDNAKIAMAHTLDDQVETFLMRLAKGSKLKGLCGIPVKRDAFIRPMLNLVKSEIYKFANDEYIPYREDYTNKDTKKLRNQIRHQLVIEIIKVFGESFYDGFQKSQQDLNEIQSLFTETMKSVTDKYLVKKDTGLEVEIESYKKLSLPERRYLLNGCVSKFYPLNFQIRSTYFEQFEQFVNDASTGKQFYFDNNLSVVKNRSSIYFSVSQNGSSEELELYPGQVVSVGRNKISLKTVENGDRSVDNDKNVELICGDRLMIPLVIRYWCEGDYFYPLGMNKKQKVSDFFINQKINRTKKKKIPLVLNKSEIIWIVGMRLDDRYKLTESCKKVYRLEINGSN